MTKRTSSKKSTNKNKSNPWKVISPVHPLSKIQEHPALSLLTVLFLLPASLSVYSRIFLWLPGITEVPIKPRTQTMQALFCMNQREIRHSHFTWLITTGVNMLFLKKLGLDQFHIVYKLSFQSYFF